MKSYKFRLYPNKNQIILLAKHFGATRFIWNYFLDQRKKTYLEDKKSLTYYNNAKLLTSLKKNLIWLNEINSQSLQASLKDLDTAYGKFFKKQTMFPKFKSKRDNINSFRCPQNIGIKDNKILLPKFRKGIKVKVHRKITGKILFATISRTSTNKYFVSITCEIDYIPLPKTNKQIGIDLGIKNLAVCSDGKVFKNIIITKKYANKLTYKQRQLSKKKLGSGKRIKQRNKVAVIHEKIRNIRLDNLHKLTFSIISENQTIVIENLDIKGMVKDKKLSKMITDASWYELTRQLEYKSLWNDRDFIKIDRWFPSSKTCNNCNFINQNLLLNDRTWTCPECKSILDRDLNASLNILKQGLKLLSVCGTQSDIKQKPNEASI